MADTAYGDGQTRQEFHAAGRTLIAKVPPIPNRGYFSKTEFRIDLECQTCTCPAGQTASLRPSAQGGGAFHFPVVVCAPCPLRDRCVRGRNGRSVALHPQEALLQEARAFQASPDFREYQTRRQVVEHRLARLVQLGIRQARYVGHSKVLFQLAMAAAVANLTLLANHPGPDAGSTPLLGTLLALLIGLRTHRRAFRDPNPDNSPQLITKRPSTRLTLSWSLPIPDLAVLRPGF